MRLPSFPVFAMAMLAGSNYQPCPIKHPAQAVATLSSLKKLTPQQNLRRQSESASALNPSLWYTLTAAEVGDSNCLYALLGVNGCDSYPVGFEACSPPQDNHFWKFVPDLNGHYFMYNKGSVGTSQPLDIYCPVPSECYMWMGFSNNTFDNQQWCPEPSDCTLRAILGLPGGPMSSMQLDGSSPGFIANSTKIDGCPQHWKPVNSILVVSPGSAVASSTGTIASELAKATGASSLLSTISSTTTSSIPPNATSTMSLNSLSPRKIVSISWVVSATIAVSPKDALSLIDIELAKMEFSPQEMIVNVLILVLLFCWRVYVLWPKYFLGHKPSRGSESRRPSHNREKPVLASATGNNKTPAEAGVLGAQDPPLDGKLNITEGPTAPSTSSLSCASSSSGETINIRSSNPQRDIIGDKVESWRRVVYLSTPRNGEDDVMDKAQFIALFDTGTLGDFISRTTIEEMGVKNRVQRCPKKPYKTFNGHLIEVEEEIKLVVLGRCDRYAHIHTFGVVEGMPNRVVFGAQTIHRVRFAVINPNPLLGRLTPIHETI